MPPDPSWIEMASRLQLLGNPKLDSNHSAVRLKRNGRRS